MNLDSLLQDLEQLCALPPDLAVCDVRSLLLHLTSDRQFRQQYLDPCLEHSQRAGDYFVAHQLDDPSGRYSVQIFVWPPGVVTAPHDHECWGSLYCVTGALWEERYRHVESAQGDEPVRCGEWGRIWTPDKGVSTLLPRSEGIHRVGNPGKQVAASVHIYGPTPSDDLLSQPQQVP